MASATVFVDDAVLGQLPPVCAKSGVATSDRLIMTVPVGGSEGFGIAWLLVLAGPIGWLGLFIYSIVRRVETLTVKLPYCDAAYDELKRARRSRRNAGLGRGGSSLRNGPSPRHIRDPYSPHRGRCIGYSRGWTADYICGRNLAAFAGQQFGSHLMDRGVGSRCLGSARGSPRPSR